MENRSSGASKGGASKGSASKGGASRMCPTCQSGKVHRSQMRGLLERGVLRNLGMRAFRCEECDARFFRFGAGSSGAATDSGIRKAPGLAAAGGREEKPVLRG